MLCTYNIFILEVLVSGTFFFDIRGYSDLPLKGKMGKMGLLERPQGADHEEVNVLEEGGSDFTEMTTDSSRERHRFKL